jgi:AP-1 complex subunit mu
MKSFLSGMPELRLGLNDKVQFDASKSNFTSLFSSLFITCRVLILFMLAGAPKGGKGIELEDVKFHQCVRLTRFENDRTISFIPPDGEFELMSYRLNTSVWTRSLMLHFPFVPASLFPPSHWTLFSTFPLSCPSSPHICA